MSRLRLESTSVGALAVLLPVLPVLAAAACASEEAPARPNIVLVVSDDQDYEHLGFMGNSVVRTPTLDRLAASGTVFSVAHTPPRCRPSLACLLSGRLPHVSGGGGRPTAASALLRHSRPTGHDRDHGEPAD